MIISLIYLRRLLKRSEGKLVLIRENWRGIVLACTVLSNKVWDDFHMRNADYCHVFKGLTLQRVNALESLLLSSIDYCCNVSPSVYAQTHFEIQSMITLTTIEHEKLKRMKSQFSSNNSIPNNVHPIEGEEADVIGAMVCRSHVFCDREDREDESTRLSVRDQSCNHQNCVTPKVPTLVFAGNLDLESEFRNTRKVLNRSVEEDDLLNRDPRVLIKYETCGLVRTPTEIQSPMGCVQMADAAAELENLSRCSSFQFSEQNCPNDESHDDRALCMGCCFPFIRNAKICDKI